MNDSYMAGRSIQYRLDHQLAEGKVLDKIRVVDERYPVSVDAYLVARTHIDGKPCKSISDVVHPTNVTDIFL